MPACTRGARSSRGDLPADTDLADLARRSTRCAARRSRCAIAAWASPDFDARFSAHVAALPLPRLERPGAEPARGANVAGTCRSRSTCWAMQAAGDPLIGEHDFSSFCREPKVADGQPAPSLVRIGCSTSSGQRSTTRRCCASTSRATSFCHQMVRCIVGTMVDVGLGHRSAGDVGGDPPCRATATSPARSRHPRGLVLWESGTRTTMHVALVAVRRRIGPYPYPVPSSRCAGWRRPVPLVRAGSEADRCPRTHRKQARSSTTGTSSTPTASSSAVSAPRSPASCAASTSRPSRRTSTPATT